MSDGLARRGKRPDPVEVRTVLAILDVSPTPEIATQRAAARDLARRLLLADNPDVPIELVERYLDAYAAYRMAQANIAEHGEIVIHPRTGAPIDNPYRRVRADAARALDGLALESDALWE